MAKTSKTKAAAASSRRRFEKLENKYRDKLARTKAAVMTKRNGQKLAVGAGLAAGGLLSGTAVGELNRRDPGYKMDGNKYVPGYAKPISYVVGVAGSILAGVADDPIAIGAGVALGQMVGQQRAIDVFQTGLTKKSKEDYSVIVSRPAK